MQKLFLSGLVGMAFLCNSGCRTVRNPLSVTGPQHVPTPSGQGIVALPASDLEYPQSGVAQAAVTGRYAHASPAAVGPRQPPPVTSFHAQPVASPAYSFVPSLKTSRAARASC